MSIPHFNIPLNLPHAATVADRIVMVVHQSAPRNKTEHGNLYELAENLRDLLAPFRLTEDNPAPALATQIQAEAAVLGRALVDAIERGKIGHDRLGQCVRNLFECLALGEEGAALSLRAGEHPHAVQRPRARKLPPIDADGQREQQPAVPPPTIEVEELGPATGPDLTGELGPEISPTPANEPPLNPRLHKHRKKLRPGKSSEIDQEEDPGDWSFAE